MTFKVFCIVSKATNPGWQPRLAPQFNRVNRIYEKKNNSIGLNKPTGTIFFLKINKRIDPNN